MRVLCQRFCRSCIDMPMLRRRELDFDDNKIISLAGATFAGEIE